MQTDQNFFENNYNKQLGNCFEKYIIKQRKLFYDIYFETISELLAVIEAPIIFLFQSLVKKITIVITEAVHRRCSLKKII